MTALLTIGACFAGLFAFGFGLAGLLGMLTFEPPKKNEGRLLFFLDQLVAGGVVSITRDIAANWSSRSTERRLVYLRAANGVVCVVLVVLLRTAA